MSNNQNLSTLQSRQLKGRSLARLDREQKILNSGSLGSQRLMVNIAIDFMEKYPAMTWEQAMIAAFGYCDYTHGQV